MPRAKKIILISAATLLMLLLLLVLHSAYAGKPFISLNAPVSFPVDI
jgi:hypothetical protein